MTVSELETLEKPVIPHTQLVKYAGASGDFNPIHTVDPIAQKAGLGGVIAHGMLIMGYAGQSLARWFDRKKLKRFQVRFSAMTYPGEKIRIEGKIMEEIKKENKTFLLGELTAINEDGDTKLAGSFEVEK
ncbi:MaoC/PaaZ C-terminal domain-containing protein [Brevibacillus sp. H7]|uniref:MaoC/PaaZ C-terminal domain-containing protein n=1 Tax=Brevibacillus sp. H7 TaxID=3349138 RepID=UPI0037F6736E